MSAFDLVVRGATVVLPVGRPGVRHRNPRRAHRRRDRAGRDGGRCGRAGRTRPRRVAGRDRRASPSRPRQGHRAAARTGRAVRETAAAAKGGITTFIPYLMATEPFETIFDGRAATYARPARGSISATTSSSRPRSNSPACRAMRRLRRAQLQDLHEQSRRRREAARACRISMTASCSACARPRRGTAAWSARTRRTIEVAWVLRKRVMARRPGRAAAGCEPGMRRGRLSSRPMRCSAPAYIAHDSRGAALYRAHLVGGGTGGGACGSGGPGRDVYIETCPHYLTHDVDWAGGDVGKINPPLREAADREALWQGCAGGRDRHRRDRPRASRSFREGGRHLERVAGLPRTGNAAAGDADRRASQARTAARAHGRAAVATNPARIMGLGHAKGAIEPGLDADFALVDLDARMGAAARGRRLQRRLFDL